MDFRNIIFYVKDLKGTVEFYEKAFGLKRNYCDEEKGYGEVATNRTFIGFVNKEAAKNNLIKSDSRTDNIKEFPFEGEIIFMVKDVEKSYEQAIKAGAIPVSKPTLMPWKQTIAYVRDINGILISLGSETKS